MPALGESAVSVEDSDQEKAKSPLFANATTYGDAEAQADTQREMKRGSWKATMPQAGGTDVPNAPDVADAFDNALGEILAAGNTSNQSDAETARLARYEQAAANADYSPFSSYQPRQRVNFSVRSTVSETSVVEGYTPISGLHAQAMEDIYPGVIVSHGPNAGFDLPYPGPGAPQTLANDYKKETLKPFPFGRFTKLNDTIVGREYDYVPEFIIGTNAPKIKDDKGSGSWGSLPLPTELVQSKRALQLGTLLVKSKWPDAADFMWHYLENTGTDYVVDLKRIIETTDAGRDLYLTQRDAAMRFATKNAIDGKPLSFVSKRLDQYTFQDNANWFYAVGNFSGWSKATVVKSGDQYSMDFDLNFHDRYNWNNGK